MQSHPNYRVSVEIIIKHKNKILLTKRESNSFVHPDIWYVPAGKVKFLEVPMEALHREAMEETNLEVEFLKELDVRAVNFKASDNSDVYRLIFTYLVKPKNDDISSFKLNDEHSEYVWVDKETVNDPKFETLRDDLRELIVVGPTSVSSS